MLQLPLRITNIQQDYTFRGQEFGKKRKKRRIRNINQTGAPLDPIQETDQLAEEFSQVLCPVNGLIVVAED